MENESKKLGQNLREEIGTGRLWGRCLNFGGYVLKAKFVVKVKTDDQTVKVIFQPMKWSVNINKLRIKTSKRREG